MKEATKQKVKKAKGFLSNSFGSDDFKKIISKGLQEN